MRLNYWPLLSLLSSWQLDGAGINLQRGLRILDTAFTQATPTEVVYRSMPIFSYQALKNYPLALKIETPKKLKTTRRFRHASIQSIIKNYNNSLIGSCLPATVKTSKCMCRKTYQEAASVYNVKNQVQSVIVINKKLRQIVVAFRPTLHLYNMLDNMNYFPVSTDFAPKSVKVHKGFYASYKLLRKNTKLEVLKKLNNPKYKRYTLHVTGYSLGAALATISIVDFYNILKKRHDKRPLELMPYSSPRVGNKAFANYLYKLKIPITRFTARNDIVPHVPPRSTGFTHVGAEIYEENTDKLTGHPKLRLCDQKWEEDPNCSFQNTYNVSVRPHFSPLGKSIQLPPFC